MQRWLSAKNAVDIFSRKKRGSFKVLFPECQRSAAGTLGAKAGRLFWAITYGAIGSERQYLPRESAGFEDWLPIATNLPELQQHTGIIWHSNSISCQVLANFSTAYTKSLSQSHSQQWMDYGSSTIRVLVFIKRPCGFQLPEPGRWSRSRRHR